LELPLPNGAPSGLRVRAFETGRDAPRFVPDNADEAVGSVIGLIIESVSTGGRLVYAPCVPSLGTGLIQAAEGAHALLMDGTFWYDDEPIRMGITPRTSRAMGHVPVAGGDGSLRWLAGLPVPYRVYVHVNNTNPMLNLRSDERRQVDACGVQVGNDGDVFRLPAPGRSP
jgi:pyrroloquinoline quinone biosynthesis protein B